MNGGFSNTIYVIKISTINCFVVKKQS